MSDKVVHIDYYLQKEAKEYCLSKGITMKEWVGKLIEKEIASKRKRR